MRRAVAAASIALLLPLAGCADEGDGASEEGRRGELTVVAAASLTDVFEDLAEAFEAEHDADVTFSFGSSTDLAEQVADGAPGDVLATADATSMGLAEEAGVTGGVETFATNVITIAVPSGNPAGVSSLADLDDATWVRCSDEVPCGRVALAVLDGAGITAEPVSLEEDARATLDKVVSGEADAGLVYETDVAAAGDSVESVPAEGAQDHPTSYLVTALEQSTDADLAADWVAWVMSADGQAILAEAGFGPP